MKCKRIFIFQNNYKNEKIGGNWPSSNRIFFFLFFFNNLYQIRKVQLSKLQLNLRGKRERDLTDTGIASKTARGKFGLPGAVSRGLKIDFVYDVLWLFIFFGFFPLNLFFFCFCFRFWFFFFSSKTIKSTAFHAAFANFGPPLLLQNL